MAVFVTGANAVFKATHSTLACGGGGDGAPGADGGVGGNGSPGQPGAPYLCATPGTQCVRVGNQDECDCQPQETQRDGGLPGGQGGPGGPGGKGGGGAGGPCYGIVVVNGVASNVTTDGTVQFNIGPGGRGALGAPDGGSGTRLDTMYP